MLAGEWEQLFSYVSQSINLIHIALNYNLVIVMACARAVLKLSKRWINK